uniref:Fibronectin type-III domain-containing protein n=1 Tax=Oncorhynchus kisutch TaxID=8019 RepID=A0A8C7H4P2_ONCKI
MLLLEVRLGHVFLSPVKPNAPFNLTVSRMSSQHRVTWMSSYEKYLQFGNLLSDNLKYQLWFYRSGHQGNVRHSNTAKDVVEVPHSTNISVNNENFEPDTEYTVNVRSIPNQQQYQGQWSEWATEVRWRTDPTQKGMVPLNKSTFIPTPAPYFQSLYADCEGDFRVRKTYVTLDAFNTSQRDVSITITHSVVIVVVELGCDPRLWGRLIQDRGNLANRHPD